MDMTEIRRLEEQKVGTLRLSEAIRIGAKRGPQCKQVLYLAGASCALGAAAIGRGWIPDHDSKWKIQEHFLEDVYRNYELWDEISRRNDSGQTREQIADWLEAQGL